MSLFRNLLIEKKRKPYYCEVEYLESTGTQWLDTEKTFNSTSDEIELYFQLTETEKYKWVFGEHDTDARLGLGSGDGTNLRNVAYYNNTYKVNDTEMYNSQHYYRVDSTGVYLNGTKIANYSNFSSTSTLYLFNLNLSSSNYMAKGKIWTFRQKRNGVLIRDLIPVLDWNYTPCMYDKVSRKLFYNRGTGTFSYGREIHYVDYLESTGTQYINTGIKSSYNLNVKIDFEVPAFSGEQRIFGQSDITYVYRFGYTASSIFVSNGSDYPYSTTVTMGDRYLLELKGKDFYVNGILARTMSNVSIGSADCYLFAWNRNPILTGSIKCFSCQIEESDILVRDFLPAIDENGVGFMFDSITHTCFLNSGSGVFKYPARQLEYIESTGTQYIDTEFKPNNNTTLDIVAKFNRPCTIAMARWSGSPNYDTYGFFVSNSVNENYAFVAYWGRYNTNQWTKFYGYVNETKVRITLSPTKVKTNYLDSDAFDNEADITQGTYQSTYNLYLFASNNIGSLLAQGNCTIYSAKIYDNGVFIRDYIPAYKDGSAGMLDKANNVMYTNAGTGTFNVGKVKESRWF